MQSFILTSALALMAGSAMAAPTACHASYPATSSVAPAPPATSSAAPAPSVYQIKNFYERKPDGKDITSVSFDIAAANNGTLDFTCDAYDSATDKAVENFEDGHVYKCSNTSLFSWSYSEVDDANKGRLFLWQGASPETLISGFTNIPEPYCHAGGAGPLDLVCVVPEAAGNVTISLTKQ
ncbi:unnamed protein product [Zymoseptoria tritici ST99CH_3D1]|nr:unnamed protein product [Zymoseptoria tritici ST99CH_3D1]